MSRTCPWLLPAAEFSSKLKAVKQINDPTNQLKEAQALAKLDLDFIQMANLDKVLTQKTADGFSSLKLALLTSTTVDHLLPSLRVAALRRGVLLDVYVGPYNQYRQEILNPNSGLYAFRPEVIALSLHPKEAGINLPLTASVSEVNDHVKNRLDDWAGLWKKAKENSGATVLHFNMVLPTEQLFGHLDSTVPASPLTLLKKLNAGLNDVAQKNEVLIVDLEGVASHIGKSTWVDAPLWFHAKQDVPVAYAPLFGDTVARVLAALKGHSAKCLVLDLDNTLWGGVIGDDGVEGIQLGQGSGIGEAFQSFQHTVKQLKNRGVILAVCSKNDEENAKLPFQKHPEMVLTLDDISVFVANWKDKAANLTTISSALNIGLDSLVFFDDNPAERALVRKFHPHVHVPEVPDDPALFSSVLSTAGYFESVGFTLDDLNKTDQYMANAKRNALKEKGNDITQFLQELEMEMAISPFDAIGRSRIAQLINKSNQYNLTTRRYTEEQVKALQKETTTLTYQVRLKDKFGDNGMISVLILKPTSKKALAIDTWLMSCRVLGRQVEQEVLNTVAKHAKQKGFSQLVGEYIPSAKNGMVAEHYPKLGFKESGPKQWTLNLDQFTPIKTYIKPIFKEPVAS